MGRGAQTIAFQIAHISICLIIIPDSQGVFQQAQQGLWVYRIGHPAGAQI